jgi:hypothetical protein
MIITREQLDQLIQFQNDNYLVTSFYLATDRAKTGSQEIKLHAKDLLLNAQRAIESRQTTHAQRESLRHDLEHIESHVTNRLMGNTTDKALAAFSCSGRQFWHTFDLPALRRNLLVANHDPYIRPLTAILE